MPVCAKPAALLFWCAGQGPNQWLITAIAGLFFTAQRCSISDGICGSRQTDEKITGRLLPCKGSIELLPITRNMLHIGYSDVPLVCCHGNVMKLFQVLTADSGLYNAESICKSLGGGRQGNSTRLFQICLQWHSCSTCAISNMNSTSRSLAEKPSVISCPPDEQLEICWIGAGAYPLSVAIRT